MSTPSRSATSHSSDDAEIIRKARRGGNAGARPGGMPAVAEKAMNFGPSLRRLLGELHPVRGLAWLAVALTAVSVVLGALGPYILGRATDLIFVGVIGARLPIGTTKDQVVDGLRGEGKVVMADMLAAMDVVPGRGIEFDAIGRVVLLVIAVYVVAALFLWASGRVVASVVATVQRSLRERVENTIHRVPLPYVDSQPRGELLSRVTNDLDNVGQSLQQTLGQLLHSLLSVVAFMAMMLWVSPLLTLVTLASIPLALAVMVVVMRRSQKLFVAQWKHTGEMNALIEEAFTGHQLVTVFGRREHLAERFARTNGELREASRGAMFISGITMPMMMLVANLAFVAVAVIGAVRVATGQLSLGSAQAYIQYSRQFYQPLSQVASMMNLIQSGVASAERVFAVLDAPQETPDAAPTQRATTRTGEVAFDNVSFSYRPDEPLLQNVNLTAEPGHTVAIVGPTGAGKTTLVNLIMRFYDIDAGRITLDGIDIRELTRAELRSRIGMVLQDTWLFEGTIYDNIAYGCPDATEAQIYAAAEAAHVDRFVHHLPDGYQTVLDDQGSNVSAGQKQLITIARAFAARPSLLILDEATSSVDTRTEKLVQQALERLRSDRTSFVIAHRLSTIRDADTIVVMEAGRIVEQGTHDELLAVEGAYRRLYHAQFQGRTT